MYLKQSQGKAFKGSVQVKVSNGRLQLVFSFGGKRHYISTGFSDTPANRRAAEMKARQIELDIVSGYFDSTLAKYKPQSSLSSITPVTPVIPDAAKRLLTQLAACCNWALKSDLISENPFKGMALEIKLPKNTQRIMIKR